MSTHASNMAATLYVSCAPRLTFTRETTRECRSRYCIDELELPAFGARQRPPQDVYLLDHLGFCRRRET